MFDASESKRQENISKQEFDKVNKAILASNLKLGDDIDYKVFTVDLSTAHTNVALGLLSNGIIADSFTVLSAPNTATIRINSPSADAITAIQGWRRQGVFRELYITNSVAGGTLQIEVKWTSRESVKIAEAAEIAAAQKQEAKAEVAGAKVSPVMAAPAVMKAPEKAEAESETDPWVKAGLVLAGLGALGMVISSGKEK